MARRSARSLWTAHIKEGNVGRTTARKDHVLLSRGGRLTGVVLGIDPSLRGTGLAVLSFQNGEPSSLDFHRTVRLSAKATMPECLGAIYSAVEDCIRRFPVTHVAVEQTIYVQNFQTAQILGTARGAAIAAAAVAGIPVYEYAPLRIKQAVVGFGRASKEQVARTLMQRLKSGSELPADEADAAGVALCHALVFRTEAPSE